jgi:hypothetical protein
MRDMSRAIRHELEDASLDGTLKGLPDDNLREFTEIVGAFFYDLVGEQDRRGWGSVRPAATVARQIKRLQLCLEAHHRELSGECYICWGVDAALDPDTPAAGGLHAGLDHPRPADRSLDHPE